MQLDYSILIKPASFNCNMRCRCCFYLQREEMFGSGTHRMSEETLEKMTADYLSVPMKYHRFYWQGGEPTLMGLQFFRKAVSLQRKCCNCLNYLQTNGTLLDEEWAKFLKDNRFKVGISLDGPEAIHNASRVYADGRGTYSDVMRAIELLKKHGVDFSVLTLVSSANQDYPLEVYEHLKQHELFEQQYIECVEHDADGKLLPISVSPDKWGSFLCSIFDRWFAADLQSVRINVFDSVAEKLVNGNYSSRCTFNCNCCNYLVIEHNGSAFPCDFFVDNQHLLGNAVKDGLKKLFKSNEYHRWGKEKASLSPKCTSCRWMPICIGDCQKNRLNGHSLLCKGWDAFFSHTIERFEYLCGNH